MALHTFDYNKETAVNIVKTILSDAIKHRATDIHLDPVKDGLLIKVRIDGELIEYTKAPENMKKNIVTRVKIISGLNITNSDKPQKGSINHEENNITYNMRVSSLPLLNGEKIVIHLSDYNKSLEGIENIGINEVDLNKIKTLLTNTSGIILVTGQIISGKTTTMYSMLKELKDDSKNIITIENPIKMKIDGINQAQVNIENGLTIPVLLESALLQDPNIIGLSEISDDETARLAVRSALNGKLIISTMPTKNIYTTLENLNNRDIEKYLLSTSLTGIISQRLVKKLCPYCKAERPATDYEKRIFKTALNVDIENIIDKVGCRECQDGYNERLPLTEVLIIDDNIKNAIKNGITKEELRNIVYQNTQNIIEDGLNKILLGETTIDEVLKVTDLNNDFGFYNDTLKRVILGEIDINNVDIDQDIEEQPVEEATEETNTETTIDENIETNNEEVVESNVEETSNEVQTDTPAEETTETPIEENNSEIQDETTSEEQPSEETTETVVEETTTAEQTETSVEQPVAEVAETTTEEPITENQTETPVEETTNEVTPVEPEQEQTIPEENVPTEVVENPIEEPVAELPSNDVNEEIVEITPTPTETTTEEPTIEEEDYDNLDYGDYQGI
ncbi:MAG: GspE/PulE family protein [Candidatus Coprovivens sp.]